MGNLPSKKRVCKDAFKRTHNPNYDYYSEADRNEARFISRLSEIYALIGLQGTGLGMSAAFLKFHSRGRGAIPLILGSGWFGKEIMYFFKVDEILTAIQENLPQESNSTGILISKS